MKFPDIPYTLPDLTRVHLWTNRTQQSSAIPMPILSLARIEARLKAHQPQAPEMSPSTRQAAVAVVLREGDSGTEALFILRAERPGDIWSGHMAFPGGHREAGDANLQQTAVRETLEEVGLDLNSSGRALGLLDYMDVNPLGTSINVYALEDEMPPFMPNSEVADVLWGSIHDMYYGASHTSREFHIRGQTQSFSGYGVRDQIVWGLTYRMLGQFFSIMDPDWQEHVI
jgi:8-oxo-dGTP pyrophosphatase MutT (NUDIX family)